MRRGGLRSGEDLPDYGYEEFEAGSAGQDRRGDDPDRDTPRSRGRYTDDGDDRIFRQATDDEQGRGARRDRGGSESGFGQGHLEFISMAINMEAMPTRHPKPLFPGELLASDEFEDRPRGPGTMVLAPRDISSTRTRRGFAGIGYDDLLSSTAGWGGSVKPESDTDRPNGSL